jgi:hypothetical protein
MISPAHKDMFMHRRTAFTLVQLLVILAVILFLFAMLVPAVSRVREAATRTESINNLKQLALSCHSYNDVYRRLPPTVGSVGPAFGTTHFHLLPFVELDDLYKKAGGAVWKNGVNGERVPLFLDPRDQSGGPDSKFKDWLATTNYAANWMVFKTGESRIPATFTDGTSNTFIFTQRYQVCNGTPTAWGYPALYTWAPMFGYYNQGKFQAAPTQADCDPTLAQSIDSSSIVVAFGDASVRSIASSISPQTWWFATDPADGHVLGDDIND